MYICWLFGFSWQKWKCLTYRAVNIITNLLVIAVQDLFPYMLLNHFVIRCLLPLKSTRLRVLRKLVQKLQRLSVKEEKDRNLEKSGNTEGKFLTVFWLSHVTHPGCFKVLIYWIYDKQQHVKLNILQGRRQNMRHRNTAKVSVLLEVQFIF